MEAAVDLLQSKQCSPAATASIQSALRPTCETAGPSFSVCSSYFSSTSFLAHWRRSLPFFSSGQLKFEFSSLTQRPGNWGFIGADVPPWAVGRRRRGKEEQGHDTWAQTEGTKGIDVHSHPVYLQSLINHWFNLGVDQIRSISSEINCRLHTYCP